MSTPSKTGYAPVNGLNLYFEIYGSGAPLVMLHGGVTGSEAFGANIAGLARGRQVIAVHQQAHGRTKDIDRPVRRGIVVQPALDPVDDGWQERSDLVRELLLQRPVVICSGNVVYL